MDETLHTGICRSAPADVLTASPPTDTLPCSGMTMASTPLACTCDGTEIAHVSDAVEHHDERQQAGLVEFGNQMIEAVICHGRHHGQHALMILARYAVDALYGHTLHHDPHLAGKLRELRGEVAVQILGHEYLVDILSGLESLHDGAYAINIVGTVHLLILFVVKQ